MNEDSRNSCRTDRPLDARVIDVETAELARPTEADTPNPGVIQTEIVGPITPTEPSQKSVVDADPRRARGVRRGVKLATAGIMAAVIGGLIINTVNWIVAAYGRSMGFGLFASATAAAGVIGAGYMIANELRSFLRLRGVEAMQQRFSVNISHVPPNEARREIAAVLAVLPRSHATEVAIKNFQQQIQVHHTAAQQIEILSQTVLKLLDLRAEEVVRSAAVQAFGITAVSPTPLTDSLFFLACSLRMVRQVAECYGHRPGIATTAHLLRRLLLEAGALGTAEVVTSTVMQHAGGAALEFIAASAAETLYAAQRMARLGIITMGMCRPFPFNKHDAPRIASLIEHLLQPADMK